MNRRPRVPVVVAAFAAAVLLASACSSSSGEPDLSAGDDAAPIELAPVPGFDGSAIHVGLLLPGSGPLAEVAAERAAGIKAYLDYISLGLGGVAGKYSVDLDVLDSADLDVVPERYEQLRTSTVLLAQVQGRAVVDAVLPGLTEHGGLAVPAPADLAWIRDPALLPVGTPDQLAAAASLSWLLTDGDVPADAALCTAVQAGADGEGWQQGIEAAVGPERLDHPVATAVAIPAAPKGERGAAVQYDEVAAAGCRVVVLVAGSQATNQVLTAAAAADSEIRWVIPAASSTLALLSDEASGLAERLLVVGDGPTTDEPLGLPELVRIRDGYAPGQQVGGAFAQGYLQAKVIVAVLEAAVSQGDLSPAGIRTAASRLRSVHFDDLAADATFGPPAARRSPTTVTLSVPDPESSTRLRSVAVATSAPFADELVAERSPEG